MKRFWKLAAGACLVAGLAACGGGGGGGGTLVAADAPAAPVNKTTGPAVAQSLAGKPITFAGGVNDFGTGGTSTTLTIGAANTFTLAAGGQSADGNLAFGSCIFTITRSDFVAPHALAVGQVVTIADCAIDLDTSGTTANGGSASVEVVISLNGTSSAPVTTSVVIQANGDILIGGIAVAKATVSTVTGGS